jgi:hypothetical protein
MDKKEELKLSKRIYASNRYNTEVEYKEYIKMKTRENYKFKYQNDPIFREAEILKSREKYRKMREGYNLYNKTINV